jgi:protein tyrosine phosphatase (PTP) superfamily phosphohydrolase (DUF442 family)
MKTKLLLPIVSISLGLCFACNQSSSNSSPSEGSCEFLAGENSLGLEFDLEEEELREMRPHEHPDLLKGKILENLSQLRNDNIGLTCKTEYNIDSYFHVADAFYADGRIETTNLMLYNLNHMLEELMSARKGEAHELSIVQDQNDILSFRDLHNVHRIDDRYLTGAQPTKAGYQWLKDQGVTDIINLRTNADHEIEMIEGLGLKYHHIGWPDMQAPDQEKVEKVISIIENAEGKVFQHCLRGVGRDMTMSCLIQVARGASAEELIEQGKIMVPTWEADQEITETGEPVQFHFIREYERSLRDTN